MFLCTCDRIQLLSFLPRNGIVAEIGTAKGDFARAIHKATEPQKLVLIDPWVHQTEGEYVHDLNNVDADTQEERYRGVLDLFAEPIASGRVEVQRRFSADAAADFADGSFDFVYIDGDHSFEGAYGDLVAFAPKLKPGGFLLGHDYTNNAMARSQGIETIEAVKRFVSETDFELVLMTLEAFPSFFLARPGPHLSHVIALLLHSRVILAEIQGFPETGTFIHKQYAVADCQGFVPTFRFSQSE